MIACPVLPLDIDFVEPPPRTLKDLMKRIERELEPRIEAGETAAYWERNSLRTGCRKLTIVLDQKGPELVDIDAIVGVTHNDFLGKLKVKAERASRLVGIRDKLLTYAAQYRWSCEAYRRIQAWDPVRDALRVGDGTAGCLGIVKFATKAGCWPATFSDATMNDWKVWMEQKEYSPYTIDVVEMTFRRRLRNAKLQPLFPNFSLKLRKRTPYYLPFEKMTEELRQEILDILDWRQNRCRVEDRIRPSSVDALRRILLQLCGYATFIEQICGITSLRQILTEEIITNFIAWLRDERKCKWSSILRMLGAMHPLIRLEAPAFVGRADEYKWLGLLIQRLPKESKDELRKRKTERSDTYQNLQKLARCLRKKLEQETTLDPFSRAVLYRDYFFCSAIRLHPWRRRNWNECRIDPDSRPNIFFGSVPRRVLRDGNLPARWKRELKANPKKKLWLAHYVEAETKGKNEIWEPLDPSLVPILIEYLNVYRPVLISGHADPGTLLVNKAGKAMTHGQLSQRLRYLTQKYLGKMLGLHIVRDIVASHAVACGCTFQQVKRALWHEYSRSTQSYLSSFNASHAAVVLEKHFAKVERGRSPQHHPGSVPARSTSGRTAIKEHDDSHYNQRRLPEPPFPPGPDSRGYLADSGAYA